MRVVVVNSGELVAPFQEPAAAMQYGGAGSIGDVRRRQCTERGLALVEVSAGENLPQIDDDILLLADHTFLSDKAFGDFAAGAFGSDEVMQLALWRTAAVDYIRPASSIACSNPATNVKPVRFLSDANKRKRHERAAKEIACFDAFYIPKHHARTTTAGTLLSEARKAATPLVLSKNEIHVDVRLPILGGSESTTLRFPVTSTVAAHVEHWIHVLFLNHLAFGALWMEHLRGHKVWAFVQTIKAFPFTKARFLRTSVRGKNCEIHPTAYVEASILGDGVKIGARATVRNSILGNNVEVGDNATVIASTMGARSYLTPKSFLVWSTTFSDAVVSNYKLQVSVVGRNSMTSTWAGLIDAKFQSPVSVQHRGQLVSTERHFIGSCIGHDAYVGAKVLIHPGRAIPNGTFITMRPDEIICQIPDGVEGGVPMVRHEGSLVPLHSLRKKS